VESPKGTIDESQGEVVRREVPAEKVQQGLGVKVLRETRGIKGCETEFEGIFNNHARTDVYTATKRARNPSTKVGDRVAKHEPRNKSFLSEIAGQ